MKVTYLYHSGFCVELEDNILIFDYYKGDLPILSKNKNIFVFASHRHPDHYNKEIFSWTQEYPQMLFILSHDIKPDGEAPLERIFFAKKNQCYGDVFQDIEILTLTSTDEGVAFAVTLEGKSIYHAGDLNWWHWEGESKGYNRNMEVNYKREVDKLAGRHFDAAFLPLDPRLQKSYDLGMKYFMEKTDCDIIYPMHMWEQYEVIHKLLGELPLEKSGKIQVITQPGQSFETGALGC